MLTEEQIREKFVNNKKIITIDDLYSFMFCPQYYKLYNFLPKEKKADITYRTALNDCFKNAILKKVHMHYNQVESVDENDFVRLASKILTNELNKHKIIIKKGTKARTELILTLRNIYKSLIELRENECKYITSSYVSNDYLFSISIKYNIDIMYYNKEERMYEVVYIMPISTHLFDKKTIIDICRTNASCALKEIDNIDKYKLSIIFFNISQNKTHTYVSYIRDKKQESNYIEKTLIPTVNYFANMPIKKQYMNCKNCIFSCK